MRRALFVAALVGLPIAMAEFVSALYGQFLLPFPAFLFMQLAVMICVGGMVFLHSPAGDERREDQHLCLEAVDAAACLRPKIAESEIASDANPLRLAHRASVFARSSNQRVTTVTTPRLVDSASVAGNITKDCPSAETS